MERYLQKLYKINKKVNDVSELDRLKDAIVYYLKNTDNHNIFVGPITKALESTKKSRYLALFLSIASHLNISESFIDIAWLQKHFERSALRTAVIEYLLKFKILIFDEMIIQKLLENKLRFNSVTYNYFRTNKKMALEYMKLKDERYVFNQLGLMINSHVFFNLKYFIKLLGSNSRLICFRAFEAFNTLFELLETNKITEILDQDDIVNIHKEITGNCIKLYLKLSEEILEIENFANFIIYGFEFLAERNEIIEQTALYNYYCVGSNNCSDNSILYKYCQIKNIIKFYIRNDTLCFRKRVKSTENPVVIHDAKFDYLFTHKYKSDICDCYEF